MSKPKETILQCTPLSVRVPLDKKGRVAGSFKTPLYIRKYVEQLQEWFYNKITKSWDLKRKFYFFDRDTYTMYLPKYFLSPLICDIIKCGGQVKIEELKAKPGADVEAPMPGFKPKHKPQEDAIKFVTDESKGPVRVVTLDPGLGKTVVSFRYTSLTKKRVLIHSALNMEDWVNRVKQWVKIPEEKIVFISGSKALTNLIAHIDEIDPVFILMPTQSLRPYLSLREHELGGRPSPDRLMEHLGVHTRIIDEYHKHLETHIKLDMRMITPVTIPLTATLESSSAVVNSILAEHLPEKIRFAGSIPNHVDVYDIGFTLNMDVREFHYKRMGMYSHPKLEEWLLEGGKHYHQKIIDRVYIPLIEEHFDALREKGQKCVILVGTTVYGDYLADKIKERFSDYRVTTFFKGLGDEEIDPQSDLIITTLQSGGTGTDIPNLITVLNTVAVKSSPENKQNIGRLRTIKGVNPRYIFTTWKDVEPQKDYRAGRSEIYKSKARKLYRLEVSAR